MSKKRMTFSEHKLLNTKKANLKKTLNDELTTESPTSLDRIPGIYAQLPPRRFHVLLEWKCDKCVDRKFFEHVVYLETSERLTLRAVIGEFQTSQEIRHYAPVDPSNFDNSHFCVCGVYRPYRLWLNPLG